MAITKQGLRFNVLKSDRLSDSLGSSANGINTNVTLDTTNEKLGTGCYNFDGSGDKIAIGTSTTLSSTLTDGSTDWTIAFWMKLNATEPNGNNAIFCQGQGNEQGLDILFDDRSGESRDHVLGIRMEGVGGHTPLKLYTGAQFIPRDTNWHHYVITADISTRTITAYRDGANAVSDSTGSGTFPSAGDLDAPMTFGYHPSGGFGDLNAKLDDCGIWNKILPLGTDEDTEGSIKWLYNTGTGRLANTITGGLVTYYSFDKLYEKIYEYTDESVTTHYQIMYNSSMPSVAVNASGVKLSDSTFNGKKLINGKWKLNNEDGTATGNCYMRVWNRTDGGTSTVDDGIIATSEPIDMATIGLDEEFITFTFASEVTLQQGYIIGVFTKDITDGTSGNDGKQLRIKHSNDTGSPANMPSGFVQRVLNMGGSGGWANDVSDVRFPPIATFSLGLLNDHSSESDLGGLVGTKTNSTALQTDETQSYWWYDGTKWKPDGTNILMVNNVQKSRTGWKFASGSTEGSANAYAKIDGDSIRCIDDSTNTGHSVIYDLGSALSNKWVIRFKIVTNKTVSRSSNQTGVAIGMFSGAVTVDGESSQDFIGFNNYNDTQGHILAQYTNNQAPSATNQTAHFSSGTGNPHGHSNGYTAYCEMIRNEGTTTYKMYTDEYSTLIGINSYSTSTSNVTGLRYFGCKGEGFSDSTSHVDTSISQIEIYDGVTSV